VRTFKLTIAYDGTAYAGWQRQAAQTTVQQTLEAAIAQVTGNAPRTLAAGRTDAGVHALGQVVAVRVGTRLEPAVLRRALNAVLPPDVLVREVAEVHQDFHPIQEARRKIYGYVIQDGASQPLFWRHYCWHPRAGRLDEAAMGRAAAALVGTHDFRSFATHAWERHSTVRTIFHLQVQRLPFHPLALWEQASAPALWARCGEKKLCAPTAAVKAEPTISADNHGTDRAGEGGWCDSSLNQPHQPQNLPQSPSAFAAKKENSVLGHVTKVVATNGGKPWQGRAGQGDWLLVEAAADGFLYNMVRAIVGTLVEVGKGKHPDSWPASVLAARSRRRAGPTAPPQGLFLLYVQY
jgi:tRNA pseudouridine(38-40) synthase